jgi:hypothetical protein
MIVALMAINHFLVTPQSLQALFELVSMASVSRYGERRQQAIAMTRVK